MSGSHPSESDDGPPPRLLIGIVVLLALLSTPALAELNRLVLEPSAPLPATRLSGPTEIIVAPPFDRARVSLLVDGREIATKTTAPYSFEVDFGPAPVERKIGVIAVDLTTKKRIQWSRVINRGDHPLSLALAATDEHLEAVTTAPSNDPVVKVTFQAGDQVFATVTRKPFRIPISSALAAPVIVATARTRSGLETAEYFANGVEVHNETYDVRTVPLTVSVVDRNGAARSDLSAGSFTIYDKGRRGKVLEFSRAFEEPISVAVVIDGSNSMLHRMDEVRSAAKNFVESAMRQRDQFALFSARSVAKREQALTGSINEVKQKIETFSAGGDTALYDSINSAIRELRAVKGRRAIVVLSDGADTSSNLSYEELSQEMKKAAIPLYVIDYSENKHENVKTIEQLRFLAVESGGFLECADNGTLRQKYRQIENDLRAQYLIRYQIADSSSPGEWRPVKVVVSSPRLSARTIRGYFTP